MKLTKNLKWFSGMLSLNVEGWCHCHAYTDVNLEMTALTAPGYSEQKVYPFVAPFYGEFYFEVYEEAAVYLPPG